MGIIPHKLYGEFLHFPFLHNDAQILLELSYLAYPWIAEVDRSQDKSSIMLQH